MTALTNGGNKVAVVLDLDANQLVAYEVANRTLVTKRMLGGVRCEAEIMIRFCTRKSQSDGMKKFVRPTLTLSLHKI